MQCHIQGQNLQHVSLPVFDVVCSLTAGTWRQRHYSASKHCEVPDDTAPHSRRPESSTTQLQELQFLLIEIGLWSCCYIEQNCESLILSKPRDWCHICCLSFVFNNFGDMLKVTLMCYNKKVFVLLLLATVQFMQYNTSGKGTNTSLSSGKWKVTV